MNTSNAQYYTFVAEGLTDKEIEFLAECERLFFSGLSVSLKLLKAAIKNTGIKNVSEAWDYWKNQRPAQDRQSIINPIELDNILPTYEEKGNDWDIFYVIDRRKGGYNSFYSRLNMKYIESLPIELVYELTPKNFYFELMQDGRLYLKYQHILGSRLICHTK